MSIEPPRTIDAAELPSTVFGARNLTSWATVSFIVIEGSSIAIALAVYLYLKRNFTGWPPPPTPSPDLLIPTINLVVLLLAIAPMIVARRAAHAFELERVRMALIVEVGITAVALGLRVLEFDALNTRWDSHAYGSVVWLLLGLHTTLLLVDLLETAVIAALMFTDRVEKKHYADVDDAALYQWFLSLSWVPVYLVVFLWPQT